MPRTITYEDYLLARITVNQRRWSKWNPYRWYRRFSTLRAWEASRTIERNWDDPIAFPLRRMRALPRAIYRGGYADLPHSYIRENQYVQVRDMKINTSAKVRRLKNRRIKRTYRKKLRGE